MAKTENPVDSKYLASVMGSDAEFARRISPDFFEVISQFWTTPFREGKLPAKVKELISLAICASASTLNAAGITLHTKRALAAGATQEEVADVLVSISPLGSHTFGMALPALLDELRKSGREAEASPPSLTAELLRLKEDFVRNRGYWTEQREALASFVPEFFKAYMALSYEPWRSGALEPKVRELIYIGIDCSITHAFEHGLRIHIRNAFKHGAQRDEILEVFELAATIGVHSYLEGIKALANERSGADE